MNSKQISYITIYDGKNNFLTCLRVERKIVADLLQAIKSESIDNSQQP